MKAIELIIAERERQVSQEGWTLEHDDQHTDESLAKAAAAYAWPKAQNIVIGLSSNGHKAQIGVGRHAMWPWRDGFKDGFHGDTRMRDLVKAGALIVAEIERLQRTCGGDVVASSGGDPLRAIWQRLHTQDNRITESPMFCVQIKVRDVGFDWRYSDHLCWRDSANEEVVFDDDPGFVSKPEGEEWEEYGYRDRWETVMVAFTQGGCEEYLQLNGHNDRRRAFRGEVQIYVESFRRCPEMIAIREFLLAAGCPPQGTAPVPSADSGEQSGSGSVGDGNHGKHGS